MLMATIHVDGKEYEVNGADNPSYRHVCPSAWLFRILLAPGAGKRRCLPLRAVKQYQNAEIRVVARVMSCMTPATDGTLSLLTTKKRTKFRESAVEWLMTNHPHDRPVCEEGGNCHLQDI